MPLMKLFFLICAAFNFLVVLAFMFGKEMLFPIFGFELSNGSVSFHYFLMALVALFGFAYYKVALDPIRYSELILFGAQAKLALVLTGLFCVVQGLALWPLLIPLAADLVFSLIFIRIYRQIAN